MWMLMNRFDGWWKLDLLCNDSSVGNKDYGT